ncbi:hypothetical protein HRJ34_15575 [Rhizorhabdus wittichii]|uniref:Uncharacterized protein n=1 Tax=Rhizorhabdus wittichii TaxID=160791 RepID=A0A975HDI9_9SPHN|nr:hypothetical protein [Rhizorhabdus wittichii]QTH19784.1 hypothetical protein HRJ34_15575 [Rhizorhabdus wittichii]
MTIVKNIAAGPRGIALLSGAMLMLEPGQTSDDVEIAKDEIAAADKASFLFGKDAQAHSEAASEPAPDEEGMSTEALAAALARAESAEARVDALLVENEELKAKLAAFDHDGDGHPGGTAQTEPASDESVNTALELLDPTKDEDWTAAGLPAVDAVATLAGGKVTRDQIKALAPDLTREAAKAALAKG